MVCHISVDPNPLSRLYIGLLHVQRYVWFKRWLYHFSGDFTGFWWGIYVHYANVTIKVLSTYFMLTNSWWLMQSADSRVVHVWMDENGSLHADAHRWAWPRPWYFGWWHVKSLYDNFIFSSHRMLAIVILQVTFYETLVHKKMLRSID